MLRLDPEEAPAPRRFLTWQELISAPPQGNTRARPQRRLGHCSPSELPDFHLEPLPEDPGSPQHVVHVSEAPAKSLAARPCSQPGNGGRAPPRSHRGDIVEVTAHRGEGKLTLPQPLSLGCLFVTARRRNKGDPAALCAWGHHDSPPWDSSAPASGESEGHGALPALAGAKKPNFWGWGKRQKIGEKSQGKPRDVKRRWRDFLPFCAVGPRAPGVEHGEGGGTGGWHRGRGPRAGKSLLGTFPLGTASQQSPGGSVGPSQPPVQPR